MTDADKEPANLCVLKAATPVQLRQFTEEELELLGKTEAELNNEAQKFSFYATAFGRGAAEAARQVSGSRRVAGNGLNWAAS